jgi:hypothetical protein
MQASMQNVDRATYDKIQRHLSDINDRITDDDIRNIRIGMPSDFKAYQATGTTEPKKEKKGN